MTGADDLGGKLLEAVSRSFYLTLKALPQGLREPLSLAYLLARAADTLADTPTVADAVKLDCLREFGRLVQAEARDSAAEAAISLRLKSDFVPYQKDPGEGELLLRLAEIFEAYRQSPARLTASIRSVLEPIVRGQMLDIERFPSDSGLRALATAGELDEYTYLVAGCVGEFWTRICLSEAEGVFRNEVSNDQMLAWGIRYGKGLQLVNILRDVSKDARMGRCYLPADELAAHGLTVRDVQADSGGLMPVMRPWLQTCREHLECGLQYLDAIQQKRLLYATALPLLLGLRTLTLLEKADGPVLAAGVKVSRGEVGKILVEAGVASLRKGGIRKMAERMSR